MRVTAHLVPGAPIGRICAVIIDVLRATTTLTVALSRGAASVVAVATTDEAIALRGRGYLACGERGGRIVPGFDLGNSPFEYTFERIAGRTLAFASTNGALALIAARGAKRRVLGAFVNAGAVLDAVAGEPDVALVCAGTLGQFSLEDAACAGWLALGLRERGARLDDASARLAATLAPADRGEVRALLESSENGRDLRALGASYVADVEFCSELNTIEHAFSI
jgi:2-phosphosulfolactate phosphatase